MPEAESTSHTTCCFSVFAAPDAGIMPRVLELFAKRGLVPARFHGDVVGAGEDGLVIDVHVRGLAPDTAEHVAACLRGFVGIDRVLTATKRRATALGA